MQLGTAGNMFHNQQFEDKIARVQAEFQALLEGKASSPPRRTTDDPRKDKFYLLSDDFYNVQKHASPTRRLMDQQKASWKHKDHLYKKMKRGEIDFEQYSLTYTVDPHRTFVIQPKEGEINYDLA